MIISTLIIDHFLRNATNVGSLLLICAFILSEDVTGQSKEWEHDVIYSEKQVPSYELPDVLYTIEGNKIAAPEEWLSIRRPQVMAMFASTIYGRIPVPETPVNQTFEIVDSNPEFFEGRCTRKIVRAAFSNSRGSVSMHLVLFVPNDVPGPVPLLIRMGFADLSGGNIEMDNIQAWGRLGNGTPLIDFLEHGFGVALLKGGEIVPDENGFNGSIHKLFYRGNQSMPGSDEWGVLAAISWQFSRAMDYLETDEDVDAAKVAILGFSKLGKSTLWAGALDTRFAMVLSQNSGCAGAALWRRKFGETLKYMSRFPHWLCGNSRKFIGVEEDLPIDQHMLIACIAPRPVYVVSGINDMWADNMGEYLSTHHATPVYGLFGLNGQATEERPKVNEPADERALAYHVRSGAHGYEQFDWDQYIRFMDYHFKRKK
jgi:hypothetical protein